MNNTSVPKILITTFFTLTALPALAVNVPQGSVDVALTGTTVATEPQLAGTVLVDDLIPFSFNGISGTFQQRVVRSTVDNTIDFYWRINNDATSKATLTQFHYQEKEVNDYGVTYNIGWRTDGIAGEVAPVKVTRFANNALAQGGAQFDFFKSDQAIVEGAGIKPGQSTPFFFIDTNKTSYEKTAQSLVSSVFIGSSVAAEAYRVGKDSNTTNAPNCTASYSKGVLQIPCVDVYDDFGGKSAYKAELKFVPGQGKQLLFELTGATSQTK